MARIRTIKPEFPQSESMGNVTRDARLLFIMIWTVADDSGRLRGNSRMLASLLFPYDDDAKRLIDGWMAQLEREKCITRYQVDGASYVQVENWTSHQKIDKPSASKLPAKEQDSRILSNPLEPSSLDQGSKDQGRDQGEDQGNSAEPQSDSTLIVPVISIPLVDKTEYPVTDEQVSEWSAAYPAVDVMQQLRGMRQWCISNPQKQKTQRGINAFIVRWLSSRQDKGGDITITQINNRPMNKLELLERSNRAIGDEWLLEQGFAA
jgi:hypothetical protein